MSEQSGAYYLISCGKVVIGEAEHEECYLEVEELKDGEHVLEWSGASVPILIKGDRLTVDVGGATGDLDRVEFPLDDQDLETCQKARILQVVLGPEVGRLVFFGSHESSHGIRKDVDWLEAPPQVDTLIELFKKEPRAVQVEEEQ